ncbi:ATP-binding protein [Halorubrum sp. Atlit-26R]|nr:ATP-binding protein [Halorubrum sp. Atlit-26R]
MTQISQIRVSGFKGIDELELEAGDFTLITGKNNAGKTSLMESIDLLFNPQNLQNFGSHIDSLINAKNSTCSISCEYRTDPQASLAEFDGADGVAPNTYTRELGLREPNEQELIDFFISSVLSIISNSPQSHHYIDRFQQQQILENEGEQISDIMIEALQDAVTNLPEQDLIPRIDGNAIVLSVNGEEFPFIYLGDYYKEIQSQIVNRAKNKIISKINSEVRTDLIENPEEIDRALNDKLIRRFGSGKFVDGKPPQVDGVQLLSELVPLSQSNISQDTGNSAVRFSDIKDYLNENSISENIISFSTDQLVFKEDGEKYPVPYEFMGSGFQAITRLLWELSDPTRSGDVLLLEEAGTHMHPGYVSKLVYRLVEIAMSEGIQIFATTHNIDFIRSFFSDNIREEEKTYLEKEFKLLQLGEPIEQIYDYEQAQHHLEELQLDLRGL